MDEVGHTHIWWHYYLMDGGTAGLIIRVWDNPFKPPPEDYIEDGYACFCGAVPDKGAAP